jgi:hypothetical protein
MMSSTSFFPHARRKHRSVFVVCGGGSAHHAFDGLMWCCIRAFNWGTAQDSFMTKLTVAAQEAIISQEQVWRRIGVELPTGITTDINVSNVGLYNWPTR